MLLTAIAHFAELVEEDPACEGGSGFSSGQTCAGSFPQFQAAHPFQGKEGSLESPQFAQGNGESVLPGISGQTLRIADAVVVPALMEVASPRISGQLSIT
jgi:hypothetical protein